MSKATEPAVVRAVTSFDGEIDGEIIRVHEGDPFESHHPAVAKWPKAFGPFTFPYPAKPAKEIPVEQATAAPGEKRSR